MALADYEVPNPSYDAPGSYYNTATGTGTTLRTNLHSIITSGYTGQSYGNSRSILPILWEDPSNSLKMILVYNNASVTKPTSDPSIPGWDAGTTWNREHSWPQSLLGVSVSNSYTGPASDLFSVIPCNPSINTSRSNKPYGITTSSGTYSSQPAYFFPGDAQKGDQARAIFYMATRYFDGSGTPSINNLSIVNGLTPSTYQMGDLQSLLKWNYTDGVDNFERRKNQLIYDNYQHNRNPFIDHPEYVWAVFGDSANSSQISVATPAGDGSSSTTVTLGNVIVGSAFGTGNVTVSKSGATPTTFDITTSGNAITTGANLRAGKGHPFDYGSQSSAMTVGLNASTATAGLKTGTITIDNTDLTTAGTGQGSADGNDTVTVNGSVFDHANASFSSPADTNSTTVDVGTYLTGSGTQSASFSIYNLVNTASFTAPLAYVSNSGTGNTAQLTSNIASAFTSTLAAGSSLSLQANLSTAGSGTFAAAYTLNLTDDTSITGATGQAITLNLAGKARNNSTIYWTAAADSAWDLSHTKQNWTDLSLNEVYLQGDTVVFDDSHSSNHAVTLNNSVAPTSVTVNHSTGSDYTISGTGAIGGSGGLTKSGSGKLTLTTNNTYTGGTTVSGGTLVVGHYHALGNSKLTINGAAVTQLQAGLTAPVQLDLLSIAGGATPTATLDVTNNNMIIHNGNISTMTAQVRSGFNANGDLWTGTGITSSTAADDAQNGPGDKAVAMFLNDDGDGNAFYTSWPSGADSGGAVSVTNTDVLIKYTFYGDADGDGHVDGAVDYSLWYTGFTDNSFTGWLFGDFDYDGETNGTVDYSLWYTGFTTPDGPLGAGGVQPVPEPGTLLLAAMGLCGVAAFARRRRTGQSQN